MRNQKLNIPATLVHNYNDLKYKVDGVLLSINEADDSCTMKFKNRVETNIPMNKLLINEGFLDTLKLYGKKVVSYITTKIKGFFVLIDKATNKVFPWSIYNVTNIALMDKKGMLPNGIHFAVSPTMAQDQKMKNLTIDRACAENEARDRQDLIKYWSRIIEEAGTTDKSIEESVKYVNEHYYKLNNEYKKALNEGIYSLESWGDDYGRNVGTKKLKAMIRENIRNQISGPLGGHANQIPLLIWGAPGIGKTAIVKQMIKDMAKDKHHKKSLNLINIALSGYTIENWTLPHNSTRTIDGVETSRFTDTPKTWLPVYLDCANDEERKRRDAFCNASKFMSQEDSGNDILDNYGHPFEGGIIFFDEFTRCPTNVQKVIMNMVNDHIFGDNFKVASGWGFLFAANRSIDENEADSDDPTYFPVAAQADRFIHVTYVPTMESWLEWATSINDDGEANVPPFITDFIKASGPSVWYTAITHGSYDNILSNPEVAKTAHTDSQNKYENIQLWLEEIKRTKFLVTPRDWGNTIAEAYKKELQYIFDENPEGISGAEYYKSLLKNSYRIETDEDGIKHKVPVGGIPTDKLVEALNDVDAGYFEDWVDEKGGYEILDPAGEFRGKYKRYNLFMSWFEQMLQDKFADNSSNDVKSSLNPILKKWNEYNAFSKHFNDETVTSIWDTGKMPPEYQADDDIFKSKISEYASTEFSKWKGVTALAETVYDTIWENYPYDYEDIIRNDVENIKKAPDLTDDEAVARANALNEEFAIKLNNKKYTYLFDSSVLKKPMFLKYIVKMIDNSEFIKQLLHFTTWICKVSKLMDNYKLLTDYKNNISDMFTLNSKTEKSRFFISDDDLREDVCHIKEYNTILTALEANPNDTALKNKRTINIITSFTYPASTYINNCINDDFNKISKDKRQKK